MQITKNQLDQMIDKLSLAYPNIDNTEDVKNLWYYAFHLEDMDRMKEAFDHFIKYQEDVTKASNAIAIFRKFLDSTAIYPKRSKIERSNTFPDTSYKPTYGNKQKDEQIAFKLYLALRFFGFIVYGDDLGNILQAQKGFETHKKKLVEEVQTATQDNTNPLDLPKYQQLKKLMMENGWPRNYDITVSNRLGR